MPARLKRVVRDAGVGKGMVVLDVGTGTGNLIPSLLEVLDGTGRVHALDVSAGMLRVAASKSFGACVTFEQADIERWAGPDKAFDRVMCNAVFPHFSHPDRALSNINRLLRSGGAVVVAHPIGRAAVNRIHATTEEVAEDVVPPPCEMVRVLEAAGFWNVSVVDEPEYYLAMAHCPG